MEASNKNYGFDKIKLNHRVYLEDVDFSKFGDEEYFKNVFKNGYISKSAYNKFLANKRLTYMGEHENIEIALYFAPIYGNSFAVDIEEIEEFENYDELNEGLSQKDKKVYPNLYLTFQFSSKIIDPKILLYDFEEVIIKLNDYKNAIIKNNKEYYDILSFNISRIDSAVDVKIDFDFSTLEAFSDNFYVPYMKVCRKYINKDNGNLETILRGSKKSSLVIYNKTVELKEVQNIDINKNIVRLEWQIKKMSEFEEFENIRTFGAFLNHKDYILNVFKSYLKDLYTLNEFNIARTYEGQDNCLRFIETNKRKAIKRFRKDSKDNFGILRKNVENEFGERENKIWKEQNINSNEFRKLKTNYNLPTHKEPKNRGYKQYFEKDERLKYKLKKLFL